MEINQEALSALTIADLVAIRNYAAEQMKLADRVLPAKCDQMMQIRYACVKELDSRFDNIFIF